MGGGGVVVRWVFGVWVGEENIGFRSMDRKWRGGGKGSRKC